MNENKENTAVATFKVVLPYIVAIIVGLFISFAVKVLFSPYIISGPSMLPTYKSGSVVKIDRTFDESELKKDTVVIYRYKGKDIVKRIVATPGDFLVIVNGELRVNHEEGINFDEIDEPGILKDEMILEEGEYFCMGDNRNNSRDCREYGPITKDDIIGVVEKIYIQ